jgi:hypothetical protein
MSVEHLMVILISVFEVPESVIMGHHGIGRLAAGQRAAS